MTAAEEDGGAQRLSEFESEIARLRIKGSSIARERRFTMIGMALAILGILVAFVFAYISKGASDSRDLLTCISGGLLGLTLSVVGAVVWLRYSLTHYLRYWLLRLVYEQRTGSDN